MTHDSDSALVLFSGGQDSATCLAWALTNFAHVETIGFAYGQRHVVELECRTALLEKFAALDEDWKAKLGESHTLAIPTLSRFSNKRLTWRCPIFRSKPSSMEEIGGPIRMTRGRGTNPTRFQKISFWRISAAPGSAIANWGGRTSRSPALSLKGRLAS